MTGVEFGLATGGWTVMSGVDELGGVITPPVRSRRSLRLSRGDPVEPGSRGGATFSAGTFFGSGMFGSRGCAPVWAPAETAPSTRVAATRPCGMNRIIISL